MNEAHPMGTLRFFEEVVSFKIRRTFGFADYKSRRLSCPTAAAPPSARGNGGERRTSARRISPHDLPFRKLNLSLTQINTPDVRYVFQTGFGFIGIRPPSRIPTHRVPGHCVRGDFSCYSFIRIRRIRSAAPRRCTNTNNDDE